MATQSAKKKAQLVTETEQAKESAKSANAATQAQIWEGDPENVEARALAELTNHAAAGKLQMSAFRPEKTIAVNGLLEVPFNVQVAGPYLSILSFLENTGRVVDQDRPAVDSGGRDRRWIERCDGNSRILRLLR